MWRSSCFVFGGHRRSCCNFWRKNFGGKKRIICGHGCNTWEASILVSYDYVKGLVTDHNINLTQLQNLPPFYHSVLKYWQYYRSDFTDDDTQIQNFFFCFFFCRNVSKGINCIS